MNILRKLKDNLSSHNNCNRYIMISGLSIAIMAAYLIFLLVVQALIIPMSGAETSSHWAIGSLLYAGLIFVLPLAMALSPQNHDS